MKSTVGSKFWAVTILCTGFATAYPFLRQPQARSSLEEAKAASPNLSGATFGERTHQSLPVSAQVAMASQRVDYSHLPSTSTLATALPEWAQPRSQLEELVQGGPQSQARSYKAKTLDQLPTWLNSADNAVSEPELASQKSRGNHGWDSALHSSPFDSSPSQNALAARQSDSSIAWPDREFDRWTQRGAAPSMASQQRDNRTARMATSDRSGGGAQGTSPDRSLGTRSGPQTTSGSLVANTFQDPYQARYPEVQLPLPEEQPADRRKSYVYQPGYYPNN